MLKGGRQGSKFLFAAVGAAVVTLAVALYIAWIVLNWRTGILLVLGILYLLGQHILPVHFESKGF